jgi:hypothetical protein
MMKRHDEVRWDPDDDLTHTPPTPDPHAFDDAVPQRVASLPEADDQQQEAFPRWIGSEPQEL